MAQGDSSMAAKRDSAYCLKEGTCQPLGGHSVWAAFPPLPQAPQAPKPILLVTAGMDGAGLFHDAIQVRAISMPWQRECAQLRPA